LVVPRSTEFVLRDDVAMGLLQITDPRRPIRIATSLCITLGLFLVIFAYEAILVSTA
jgi:hypothetical protein